MNNNGLQEQPELTEQEQQKLAKLAQQVLGDHPQPPRRQAPEEPEGTEPEQKAHKEQACGEIPAAVGDQVESHFKYPRPAVPVPSPSGPQFSSAARDPFAGFWQQCGLEQGSQREFLATIRSFVDPFAKVSSGNNDAETSCKYYEDYVRAYVARFLLETEKAKKEKQLADVYKFVSRAYRNKLIGRELSHLKSLDRFVNETYHSATEGEDLEYVSKVKSVREELKQLLSLIIRQVRFLKELDGLRIDEINCLNAIIESFEEDSLALFSSISREQLPILKEHLVLHEEVLRIRGYYLAKYRYLKKTLESSNVHSLEMLLNVENITGRSFLLQILRIIVLRQENDAGDRKDSSVSATKLSEGADQEEEEVAQEHQAVRAGNLSEFYAAIRNFSDQYSDVELSGGFYLRSCVASYLVSRREETKEIYMGGIYCAVQNVFRNEAIETELSNLDSLVRFVNETYRNATEGEDKEFESKVKFVRGELSRLVSLIKRQVQFLEELGKLRPDEINCLKEIMIAFKRAPDRVFSCFSQEILTMLEEHPILYGELQRIREYCIAKAVYLYSTLVCSNVDSIKIKFVYRRSQRLLNISMLSMCKPLDKLKQMPPSEKVELYLAHLSHQGPATAGFFSRVSGASSSAGPELEGRTPAADKVPKAPPQSPSASLE